MWIVESMLYGMVIGWVLSLIVGALGGIGGAINEAICGGASASRRRFEEACERRMRGELP